MIFSGLSFFNNWPEFNRKYSHPEDLSDRNILLMGAEDLFLKFQHPLLGYGPKTFQNIFPYTEELFDKKIGSWHNDFIQIYFESGILEVISFLILIIIPCRLIIKLLKKDINNDYKNILWGILFGISGLVLSALTAGFIDSPVLSILFAFLIALVSAADFLNYTMKIQAQ
jgi:O-antigen ligase